MLWFCHFRPQRAREGATTQNPFALLQHFPRTCNLRPSTGRRLRRKCVCDQKSLHINELQKSPPASRLDAWQLSNEIG